MRTFFITVVIVLLVVFFTWLGVGLYQEKERAGLERLTYTGRVTVIVQGNYVTEVWLNSQPEVIKIANKNKNVQLAVGEVYEITLDGHGCLINAVIKD